MNQMTTFILIFSGISILFYVMGIGGANTNPLLDLLTNPSAMPISSMWLSVASIITFAAAGLTLGVVYKNLELGVMTAIVPVFLSNIIQFVSVINIVYSMHPILAVLILAPILLLFYFTIPEYWRGRD